MNKIKKPKSVLRLFKLIREFYPVMFPVAIICIIISALVGALPAVFMQRVIAIIEVYWESGDWTSAWPEIFDNVSLLVILYIISLTSSIIFNQLMAIITQGSLMKLRIRLFTGMQELPISYFDTNYHGDIMSHFTNDVDTLRQMISQSFPQLLLSFIVVVSVFFIMLFYSLWLTLIVVLGFILIYSITRVVAGKSSKFFFEHQTELGVVEGYVEEMMIGQRVIKVFSHENESKRKFDELNEVLYEKAESASRYANILAPIVNNIGNVLYVLVALSGGLLLTLGVQNVSISGLALSISIVVPFLNMTRQFVGNINQVTHQINSVVMGIAGTQRIFNLMDREPEIDEGKVTLVNTCETEDGLTECDDRTGTWAWKVPKDDSFELVEVKGDVRFKDVDFSYVEGKTILKDISLFAKPGQKIAFVGATGAGKTTITNLINRFYDIQKGIITYDGIDIKDIKKDDLRRSLGIVLQDTNLFTGTVMDNIKYGKLDATDEEAIEAAKLAGADDFITRLPDGYQTVLLGDGSNLSQGQRQLLSIARAAIADPPVMILDEATSSIDTRTEAIVQRGMDALMEGRTVFVIAHRLSTVKNSNAIIVLDHGEIIERGDHQDLIEQGGQYYQLYTGAFELE